SGPVFRIRASARIGPSWQTRGSGRCEKLSLGKSCPHAAGAYTAEPNTEHTMGYPIFLAGAARAIGKPLVTLLRGAGHQVPGTTRSAAKADALRKAGAEPVVVDVFDAAALSRAVAAARPEIVIHQLTDLAAMRDGGRSAETLNANSRIR